MFIDTLFVKKYKLTNEPPTKHKQTKMKSIIDAKCALDRFFPSDLNTFIVEIY